ncbi:hypothetical protein KIP69_09345 [Geobacter sulfurreducens]|uniref:class I SAM-dependent methyltransferase n=1 Tax=Geobacter sulfurreducens TaxID=35554 RepID=UPI001BDCE423|nr:class I SAM-dependent methyltransferase [Geobacter sulfurreducens]QVW33809.1 hypothetical protein KIP69_09345 [Geobacter sulfurreducens]
MKAISVLAKIKHSFKAFLLKPTWSQIEYFNPDWKHRISLMATHIPEYASVVDLGCGRMWLREFLSPTNKYFGVDYCQRDSETIVVDLNKKQYPNIVADIFFISGCLEYVDDYESLVRYISNQCKRCIISYCSTDEFSDIAMRRKRAWVNDLSRSQLVDLFARNDMKLTCEDITITNNLIFIFDKNGSVVHG